MAGVESLLASPAELAPCCAGSYELKVSSSWALEVVGHELRATCTRCARRFRITVNIEALEGADDGGGENGEGRTRAGR